MNGRGFEAGLGYRGDQPMNTYGPLAARAEQLGFDVITVFGDLLFYPPVAPLLEMARTTSRMRLGPACWNPYTTHPYEIAGQLAALDELSGGRGFLGLARGAWLDTIGVEQRHVLTHLRETVAVVRTLLTGDPAGFQGRVFAVPPNTRLRHRLPQRMPRVLIGTWGRRTAALAGAIADEVKIGGTTNPAMVEQMASWLADGADAAGRETPVDIVIGAVTVVDEDGERARSLARAESAMYLAVVAALDPTIPLPAGLVRNVQQRLDAGDDVGAGELIPDELLALFAFAGTPAEVAAQAQRLLDAGVHRIEFGPPHGLTDAHGVELLGTQVIPALQARQRSRL